MGRISLILGMGGGLCSLAMGYEAKTKIIHLEPKVTLVQKKGESLAASFAQRVAKEYQIEEKAALWQLRKVKPSLLGKHYYFHQTYEGHPIRDREIIVSLNPSLTAVTRYFVSYTPPFRPRKSPKKMMSLDQAYDLAWNALGVQEGLLSKPKASPYFAIDKLGRLAARYEVFLHVKKPYGAYKITLDSDQNQILRIEDERIYKNLPPQQKRLGVPAIDRKKAFASFVTQLKSRDRPLRKAEGTAQVFDPDPRTTLKQNDLQDDSEAEAFRSAYRTRRLPDISFDGEAYRLEGPFVTILDFDPPTSPPTVSQTGEWLFERGQSGFNDAMTYYHVDKNQRYIQSLGFQGDKGIQNGPIIADADGASGADNSFYQPSRNAMAFGHGCVDDNEDADVILHEYGHAIHHSINDRWFGGDTGAMGEGFGDYWAASYSLATENGGDFLPHQVFHWDGHGEGNSCWSGRVLNALELRYDHEATYGAHASLPGGRQSDELWSTPLFQALLELMAQGVPREEVDQIILESHFGLGSNLKMRDLAEQTIKVAGELHPDGPHAEVFRQKFLHHKIIEVPHVDLAIAPLDQDAYVLPGGTYDLYFSLSNEGNIQATRPKAVGQNTEGVDFIIKTQLFPDVAPMATEQSDGAYVFEVSPLVTCGDPLRVPFLIETNQKSFAKSATVLVGKPVGGRGEKEAQLAIPDNNPRGITSSLSLTADGVVDPEHFHITLTLTHTYIGDLEIYLDAPTGERVLLHNRTGGGQDDLVGTYPTTLVPADSLEKLDSVPLAGEWRLTVKDLAGSDTGELVKWGIESITGYDCSN